MKITDKIRQFFFRREYHVLRRNEYFADFDWFTECHPFGETIYLNIVEILTDIYSEVTWVSAIDTPLYKAWKNFVTTNGQRLLVQLFNRDGYAVIGWKKQADQYVFWQMAKDEYEVFMRNDETLVRPYDASAQFYVLKSPTYDAIGKSDKALCMPYIKYLDNILNGSSTIASRLGTFVIGSPSTPSNAPAAVVLSKEQKNELERQIQNEYGSLSRQKQVMLLPNGMQWQVINLAGLDQKTAEKARLAILAICDRIKVPANQVAIIDANASKSLSNGTELREGDMSKYRSFRRLLNATLYDFGVEIGLRIDYTIENEPKSVQGQTIQQQ